MQKIFDVQYVKDRMTLQFNGIISMEVILAKRSSLPPEWIDQRDFQNNIFLTNFSSVQ